MGWRGGKGRRRVSWWTKEGQIVILTLVLHEVGGCCRHPSLPPLSCSTCDRHVPGSVDSLCALRDSSSVLLWTPAYTAL